ncbi:PAS domain S-box protein [Nocardioides sp. TRM66260-LWL]|uniref:ATP-binding protein n=1 Tax=Nocardioides sp. TRM66260-LWL TaxID=2874478 RepID=UPI001CC80E5C|nr:ATP-binding protein [Nocardioides sp. TRM66260-LWL]MBZ5733398.1 PAS domain S-box protein [Nocardioides sp. TRM66260-LWL]
MEARSARAEARSGGRGVATRPVAPPRRPLGDLGGVRTLLVLGMLATLLADAVVRPVALAPGLALATPLGAAALVAVLVGPRRLQEERGRARGPLVSAPEHLVRPALAAAVAGLVAALVVAVVDRPDDGWSLASLGSAHAVALLLAVTPVLARRRQEVAASGEELALQVVALGAMLAILLHPSQHLPLGFLPLIAVGWATVRMGVHVVAAELGIMAVAVAVATRHGAGPFAHTVGEGLSVVQHEVLAQATVLVQSLLCLTLTLATQQRARLLRRVRAEERRYRRSFEQSAVGQLLLHPEHGALVVSDLNEAAVRLLGRAREQLVATRLDQHLEGRRIATALGPALRGEMMRPEGLRLRAGVAARPERRVEITVTRISGPQEPDLYAAQLLDTTAESEARRRLEDAEKLTSATLDTTACVILVTDLDGRIVRVNAATTALTGYAAEDLVGVPLWRTTLAPEDASDLEALFLWPNRDGTPVVRESDVVTRSGDRHRLVWTSNLVRDEHGLPAYAVMTGIDITSERAASELVTHLLQAPLTTALVGIDGAGLITVFNPGAQRLLGMEGRDRIGRPFAELFDPAQLLERTGAADLREAVTFLAAVTADGQELPAQDWTWVARDGSRREVSMSLSLIDPGSGPGSGSLLCVARDVTEQRRSQQALLAALERERTAVERLSALDDAKNEFVSTVSHELRTPVTSILGYTEMLLDGTVTDPDEEQERLLRIIARNGTRLIDLCNDLLTLSGLDAGTIDWRAEEVDLAAVLRSAAEAVRPLVAGRRLHFEVEAASPVVVDGDGSQLERVLLNLLSNAVKFTEDDGLVHASVSVDDDHAVVTVRDTGIGIPADEQDRLFQRFFRSTTAQRQAIQGTGLGLSIVQAIVEAHGGSVRVRSAHQEGSTFSVRLPLARR